MTNGPAPAVSDLQLARYARDAGFVGEALVTMVAVALAESGGDPDNVGDEGLTTDKWGPSIGLAQIRSLWEDLRTGRTRDPARLTDPAFNLRSAWSISGGGSNFRPWSMFTNGGYQAFLARARAAVAGLAGGKVPQGLEGSAGAAGGPQGLIGGGLVDDIVGPLLEGAARIALVGVLLAGGVTLIASGGWAATRRAASAT